MIAQLLLFYAPPARQPALPGTLDRKRRHTDNIVSRGRLLNSQQKHMRSKAAQQEGGRNNEYHPRDAEQQSIINLALVSPLQPTTERHGGTPRCTSARRGDEVADGLSIDRPPIILNCCHGTVTKDTAYAPVEDRLQHDAFPPRPSVDANFAKQWRRSLRERAVQRGIA